MRLPLLLAAALASLVLAGCGPGAADPCGAGFSVRFAVTSVKEGLPLDSLFLRISLGGGDPQEFQVDIKTGRSSAAIRARQGEPYTLAFALFSAGRRIGGGEESGRLGCDLDVELNPLWDDTAVAVVKKDLEKGSLLPSRLTDLYDQAVAGEVFALPLDSLDSLCYRWYLKRGDSTVMEGEGRRVRFTMPGSLAGETVALRLHALSLPDSVIREERRWAVRVLAARPADRLERVLVRTDSSAALGSSLAYRYDAGRLVRIEGFDALSPAAADRPAWAETLHYEAGRLARAAVRLPDGSLIDSLFAYGKDGLPAAVTVRNGRDTVTDSLFHASGRLSGSRRYANGRLQESAVYAWTGPSSRSDSVWTPGDKGLELTRVIRNRYEGDSLAERTVLAGRGILAPYKREVLLYNGFGARVLREVYAEGAAPLLESSERSRYDGAGRLASLAVRDEVAGESLLHLAYLYAAAPAAKSAARPRPTFAGLAALAEARFAHEGWRLARPSPLPFPPGVLP